MTDDRRSIDYRASAKSAASEAKPAYEPPPPEPGSGDLGLLFRVLYYFVLPIVILGCGAYMAVQEKEEKQREQLVTMNREYMAKVEDLESGHSDEYHQNRRKMRDVLMRMAIVYNQKGSSSPPLELPNIELLSGEQLTADTLTIEGLELVAITGDTVRTDKLLQEGANANQAALKTKRLTGDKNWTVLHLAAYAGHSEVVKSLLEHGANSSAGLEHGETPSDLASQRENDAVLEVLYAQE